MFSGARYRILRGIMVAK